jgi:hypothetical protein
MSFAEYCDHDGQYLGTAVCAENVSNDGSLEEIFEAIVARMDAILNTVPLPKTLKNSYGATSLLHEANPIGSYG